MGGDRNGQQGRCVEETHNAKWTELANDIQMEQSTIFFFFFFTKSK